MKIERVWAMPNKWTFKIKRIAKLLDEEVVNGFWVDPFAGKYSRATLTNDLNPDMKTNCHLDAIDFLKEQKDLSVDGILLDPPYSLRQISEHYKKAGIKVTGWHTSSGWSKSIKDECARILKPNGKIISFGWSSMGLGLSRGFETKRVLLVPHGGNHHDTICVVEIKS